ncbi:response regulator [Candidatus Sumerlaeota bacterium]|nr:response regulator [Candidatus Sumerlaeota bacterium]
MENHSKHILLAEDEPHTRFAISLILRKSGYKVSTSKDGLTAFDQILKYKDSADSIDLLLTDVEMAGLNGLELIEELEKERISLPVLVITGYGHEERFLQLRKKGNVHRIDKPFVPQDIVDQIDQILSMKAAVSA